MSERSNHISTAIPPMQTILHDIPIGIVIALLSIPISMGYASVAGLPVVYGLYGSVLPIIIFGLLSSSPRFVFGVDAAPAALVCGILASLEIEGESGEAIKIIPVITLLVTLWLLIFYLLRANRLLKFISQPVMGGFITGIGITIILMQTPKLFGGNAGAGEIVELLIHIIEEAEKGFHVLSLLLGVGTIVVILVCKKIAPKLPIQVIVMLLGATATYFVHIDTLGVRTLPEVASGLPRISWPDVTVLGEYQGRILDVIFPSLSIALVIFTETLLATSNVALKYDDKINSRKEILAYSVSNLSAALFGVCPVNGSVSRTGIANQYGVKSQTMSLSAGITMLLILLFGTGFIRYLPVPVLTGIVISALIGTFEFELAKKLKKVDKAEYFIFYMVLLAVLLFGTVYGVLVGVLLAQVTFMIRQSIPSTAFLGVIQNMDGYHSLEGRMGKSIPIEGVVLYRFTGALFYANIDYFCEELENGIKEDTKVVIVDAGGMGSVDVSAAERLVILYHKLKKREIAFYIAGHVSEVNDQLYNFGAGELISEGVVRSRILLALQNAGLNKPYKLEADYLPQQKPYAQRLAEFSWAFGARAEEKMKELVRTIASEIAREGLADPAKIREKEREMARGYWSSADEVVFLTELELELALLREEGELSQEKQEQMEEKILARDTQLEDKIRSRSEESAQKLAKNLKKLEKYFQQEHPKAYDGLLKERKRFRK
ncbi:MAG: SulP family inorganic anion transporter [Lachnospiraceae bacterium]|nr:SulP family inorganic anion transporter [Lachnospiraceae bacterium]